MTGEGGPPLEAGVGACPAAVSGVARWAGDRPVRHVEEATLQRAALRGPSPQPAVRVEEAAARELPCDARRCELLCV